MAAAGVDHRRAGADARIRGLARAGWHRGRHARRFDAAKGTPPALTAELRTLAGCVWHTGRYRCGNGIVMAATTAGRLREALAEPAADRSDARGGVASPDTAGVAAANGADPPGGDSAPYLSGRSGTLGRRALLAGHARDRAADVLTLPQRRAVRRAARSEPPRRRVHVAGVTRPELAAVSGALAAELARSRHDVALHLAPGEPGRGKWENLRAALAAHPPDGADWLLVADDDVVLPAGFLDAFLLVAERVGLRLAQPAHAFASHAAWPVTRRRPGLLARRTRFVEIGPVTALHADAFPVLLPFPDLRMGWGLDAHWSAAAAAAGLPLGVVDATPVRHLRPVAATYPRAAAEAEAARFLAGRPYVDRAQAGRGARGVEHAVTRVAVVAEYYPRAADPVLGAWAHRQALAARAAGADVRVLVLHRPVPPRAALAGRDARALVAPLRQPLRTTLDGIPVTYVPFLAPPRPRSYGTWGAWAAPTLRLALRRLRRTFPYDLIHAHYAAPAGDAVRRAAPGVPAVVSVHGGDVLDLAERSASGGAAVRAGLAHARVVLANSAGIADRCRALGAGETRVVHLGTDLPAAGNGHASALVTVAHLVARKRHADVLRALWLLRDSHPDLRYHVVGDGPERGRLERLAADLGLDDRVRFHGALAPSAARAVAQAGGVFVLPSVDEAFGVAYVEAMAGAVPAIGCRGEPGPEEIAAAGGGLRLVPPADPEALAAELRALLDEPEWRRELGAAARATVEAAFTWERCGRDTVAAYEAALR